MTAREIARMEKQRKLAEILREKVDAQENGVNVERKRNWEYSIEEDQEWQKRLEKKARRADFEFHGMASAWQKWSSLLKGFNLDETQTAHRKYKKDLDLLKPDLVKYAKQKEVALGLEPGALVNASPTTQQQIIAAAAAGSSEAADYLYRDANTLLYADSQPSEDAIDRVVNKLNTDLDKRAKWSRKRLNTDEGDITYINERNRVFNKKVHRHIHPLTFSFFLACTDKLAFDRLGGITTSIPRRSGRASSVGLLYSPFAVLHRGLALLRVSLSRYMYSTVLLCTAVV